MADKPQLRVGFGFGDLPAPFSNTGADPDPNPVSVTMPVVSFKLGTPSAGLTPGLVSPGFGIPVGFWGARHDVQGNPVAGESTMERAVATHSVNAFQNSQQNQAQVLIGLDQAAAVGATQSFRMFKRLSDYGAGPTFDLQGFEDDVDAFWVAAEAAGNADGIRAHSISGVLWGINLGDDIAQVNTKPTIGEWDAMAAKVKEELPDVSTWIRLRPGQIPNGTYTVLDMLMPQIRPVNEPSAQNVIDWTDSQLNAAASRNIPVLTFSTQMVFGTSSIRSGWGADGRMGTPADLERTWGHWLTVPEIGAIFLWEYDNGTVDSSALIPTLSGPSPPAQDCTPDNSYADWFDDLSSCGTGLVAEIATHVAAAASHAAVSLTR